LGVKEQAARVLRNRICQKFEERGLGGHKAESRHEGKPGTQKKKRGQRREKVDQTDSGIGNIKKNLFKV